MLSEASWKVSRSPLATRTAPPFRSSAATAAARKSSASKPRAFALANPQAATNSGRTFNCSIRASSNSGDAAVVAAGAALELSERTISVRRFGLSRSSTHTGAWSLAPSLPRVSRSTPTSRRRSASAGLSRTWSMRRPPSAARSHVRSRAWWPQRRPPTKFRAPARPTPNIRHAAGYLPRRAIPSRRRTRSEADGRSVVLRLTDKGKETIARYPFEALVRAVDSLDPEEQTAVHRALRRVLTTVAASGAHRHFGVCRDCGYLRGEACCPTRATQSALECLLFGVPIEPEDAGLLCVHFSARERAPRGQAP